MGSGTSRRRTRRSVIVMIVVVGAPIVWAMSVWMRASFNPLEIRQDYRYGCPGLIRYCLVPVGTPEASLRRKFGSDLDVVYSSDGSLQAHIKMRLRNAWTTPARIPADRVLLYMPYPVPAEVYYFIDDAGKLAGTFVGVD